MAIIKKSELKAMSNAEIGTKIKELRLELTKAYVTANRPSAKTKEIKRTIARLITLNKSKNKLKNNQV